MKKEISKNNNWKIWEKSPGYGENLYYKRATGELGEMESSKALCKVLSPLYKKEMKILDAGCGAGHYLRSFRGRIDKNIDYTGLDATKYFVKLAKMAFGEGANFIEGDIFNMPFKNNSFDIVNCSNVILHLPPIPQKAISEMIRVAKKYVVIRTVFGERNYIIREVRPKTKDQEAVLKNHAELIGKDGDPASFNFSVMIVSGADGSSSPDG